MPADPIEHKTLVEVVRLRLFQHRKYQAVLDPLPIMLVKLIGTQRIFKGLL